MTAAARGPDRALLIGIDHYQDGHQTETRYPHLRGAVHDAETMANLARVHFGVEEDAITLISASHDRSQPATPPTAENLVHAWREQVAAVGPGGSLLVFYAGHGGRARSRWPALKRPHDPERALDEVLVPWDANRGGRYLRDLELAYLIGETAARDVHLTLVLDCCHAAGAVRDPVPPGTVARVGRGADSRSPAADADSLVADDRAVTELWQRRHGAADHRLGETSGWARPDEPTHVVLAACRAHELAVEGRFDGDCRQGLFTFALCRALGEAPADMSLRRLFARIEALVYAHHDEQAPIAEGAIDRAAFGGAAQPMTMGRTVLRANRHGLVLRTGESDGTADGTRFAIFPWHRPLGTADQAQATVKVPIAGIHTSQADILEMRDGVEIVPGAQAVPIALPGARRLRVFLDPGVSGTVSGALASWGSAHLEVVARAADADFGVRLEADGTFLLLDTRGAPLPHQAPHLAAADAGAGDRLTRRLIHLGRYRALQRLRPDGAPLAGAVEAALCQEPDDPAGSAVLEPLSPPQPGAPPVLTAGAPFRLWISSRHRTPLSLCVLDLRPDWSAALVYPDPRRSGRAAITLEPGGELRLGARARLPDGLEHLLVVVADRPLDLLSCELPPLAGGTGIRRAATGALGIEGGWLALRLPLRIAQAPAGNENPDAPAVSILA